MASNKKGSKKIAQKRHAKQRALQRYGIDLNKTLLRTWVEQIHSGSAKFLERQSNRVSVFEITYNDKQIPVVYDRIRKTIVTALPTEYYKSLAVPSLVANG